MGTQELYSGFELRYEQIHSRNEFSGHENMSIDTLIENLDAKARFLNGYTSEILELEKFVLAAQK